MYWTPKRIKELKAKGYKLRIAPHDPGDKPNKKLRASHVKEAISPKQSTDRGGRAPEDLSDKPQAKATSLKPKRRAKHQASSIKPAER